MGLFGLLATAIIGGVSAISASNIKKERLNDLRQYAIKNGDPFCSDGGTGYIYMPTNEKCLKLFRDGEWWLVSCSTHRKVFNFTKYMKNKERRQILSKVKSEVESYGYLQVNGFLEGYSKVFIFDANTMAAYSLTSNSYISGGKYHTEYYKRKLDANNITYIESEEITEKEYNYYLYKIPEIIGMKLPTNQAERLKEWQDA